MRTQQEKIVTIESKDYLVKKFTPEVACYWATRMFGDMMGMMSGNSSSLQSKLPQMIRDFTRMDRSDFVLFQRDCLSFVAAKFGNEFHPLVNSDGFFTQPDLSGPEAFQLTLHSFMFTIIDFLDQSLLEGLLGAIPDSMAKETGSANSSLSPSGSNTGNTPTSGMGNTQSPTSSIS